MNGDDKHYVLVPADEVEKESSSILGNICSMLGETAAEVGKVAVGHDD